MSNSADYKEVVEAIGMLANKSTISNKLNRVFAHTKDVQLQNMVGNLLAKLPEKGINTKVISLRASNAVKTKEIESYCREKLERDVYQVPVSKV
jgi:hypothetical protein